MATRAYANMTNSMIQTGRSDQTTQYTSIILDIELTSTPYCAMDFFQVVPHETKSVSNAISALKTQENV